MYEEERARKKIQETKKKTDLILKAKERKEKEMHEKLLFSQSMREEEMQNRERFTADRKQRSQRIQENMHKIAIANQMASFEVKESSKKHQVDVMRFKTEVQQQKAIERKQAQDARLQVVEKMRKAQHDKLVAAKVNYDQKKKKIIDKTKESDGKAANLSRIEEGLLFKVQNTFDEQEREVQRLESLFSTPSGSKKGFRGTQGSFMGSGKKSISKDERKKIDEVPELKATDTIESKASEKKLPTPPPREEAQKQPIEAPVEMPPKEEVVEEKKVEENHVDKVEEKNLEEDRKEDGSAAPIPSEEGAKNVEPEPVTAEENINPDVAPEEVQKVEEQPPPEAEKVEGGSE